MLVFGLAAVTLSSASATNVYITPDGSSQGACTGLAHPPSWFNTSSNWGSGAMQIGPGTTVHLCGTVTGAAGSTALTFQGNGSSGSPITLLFEAGAQLNSPYWSSSNGAIDVSGRSWVVVDGGTAKGIIQDTANGTGLGNHANTTGIQANGCSNCEIKNLTIKNLYVHTSDSDTGPDVQQVNCVQFYGSNLSIHDNVMRDVGWCLYQNYHNDSSVKIYNNDISNFAHGIVCAGANYIQSDISIYNNHLHDMANWNTTNDQYHLAGIHCYNGSGGKIQNAYIYNNLFDGSFGNCCITGWIFLEASGSGTPWTDATGTAYLWNNIFVADIDVPNAMVTISNGTNHSVYNNTFIGPNGGNNGVCINIAGAAKNVALQNNVIEGCTQLIRAVDPGATYSTIDYNTYGNSIGGNPNWQFLSKTATSLLAWRTACSCDSHSTASLGGALASLSSEGIPSNGFVGLNAASNLTPMASGWLASLAKDTTAGDTRTPAPRPAGSSAWDSGAYSAGPGGPGAPTGLTAAVR
jgi:hypothetical protein